MTEPLSDLVRYRLDRALESLEDAKLLAGASRWNPCVNRLYYACFYAVSALLAAHGFSAKKHSGVLSLFNLHFVKTEKLSKETVEIYSDLYDSRQEGDYTDFVRFTSDQVLPQLPKAEAFIKAIQSILR
jgi:uncharacterized protein (UPF0332 family)